MQTVTLLASFFEESRIKALSLQKDGETALLLWIRLFFAAVREDGDGTLTLYSDVPHDEKSISIVYGVPVGTVKSALELLVKFGLLVQSADHYAISNFSELLSAHKRERHRQSQKKYAEAKGTERAAGTQLTKKPQVSS